MMKMMMHHNNIPFSESRLEGIGLPEVYTRMCSNLISIYSHSRNSGKERMLLDLLLAISPNSLDWLVRHAQVCITPTHSSYTLLPTPCLQTSLITSKDLST